MKGFFRVVVCLAIVSFGPNAGADEGGAATVAGKPALVVMDMQNAFLPYMDQTGIDHAMRVVNGAIDLFRAQGLPIVRVYHSSPEHGPPQDSEGFRFPETIRVQETDPMIVKSYPSAFKETDLEAVLREHGCDTVFLVGLSATGCVMATYWDAVGLEMTTFMVRGALISHDVDLTRSVEEMTGAVGYKALAYMVEHAPR
jgi:nicotinamidase-related amidase